MTVEELRKKLDGLDPKMQVVAVRESDGESEWFEVDDASPQRGAPSRDGDGRVGFTYGYSGPTTWLFISLSER